MLTLIVIVLLAIVFFRLLGIVIRGAFGILAVLGLLIFFPVIMIGLIVLGFGLIALPVLIVVGIISLIASV